MAKHFKESTLESGCGSCISDILFRILQLWLWNTVLVDLTLNEAGKGGSRLLAELAFIILYSISAGKCFRKILQIARSSALPGSCDSYLYFKQLTLPYLRHFVFSSSVVYYFLTIKGLWKHSHDSCKASPAGKQTIFSFVTRREWSTFQTHWFTLQSKLHYFLLVKIANSFFLQTVEHGLSSGSSVFCWPT